MFPFYQHILWSLSLVCIHIYFIKLTFKTRFVATCLCRKLEEQIIFHEIQNSDTSLQCEHMHVHTYISATYIAFLNYIHKSTVKLGYSNIGFCDTLSIASDIINIVVLSFITTLFLGPFDDVITKFYCIWNTIIPFHKLYINILSRTLTLHVNFFYISTNTKQCPSIQFFFFGVLLIIIYTKLSQHTFKILK
jgi:hypothetical protein